MAANHVSSIWTKMAKLHHGPLWSIVPLDQSGDAAVGKKYAGSITYYFFLFILWTLMLIFQVKVNVPGLSERTLRRDFEKAGVALDAKIQVHM